MSYLENKVNGVIEEWSRGGLRLGGQIIPALESFFDNPAVKAYADSGIYHEPFESMLTEFRVILDFPIEGSQDERYEVSDKPSDYINYFHLFSNDTFKNLARRFPEARKEISQLVKSALRVSFKHDGLLSNDLLQTYLYDLKPWTKYLSSNQILDTVSQDLEFEELEELGIPENCIDYEKRDHHYKNVRVKLDFLKEILSSEHYEKAVQLVPNQYLKGGIS